VAAETEKVYLQASLSNYSIWQRFLIILADWAFYGLIKLIGWTISFDVHGKEALQSIEHSGKVPIYAVWHDRIFLGTYFLQKQGIVFLTSRSFDGEYIARFLHRFGFGVIRGSSNRGGVKALVEMVRGIKQGLPMGFTVDGPKGPRYEVKPGVVMLAGKSGNPILPFIVTPKRYFTINSWDKLQIPIPFTRALVSFGDPIEIGSDGSVETQISRVQSVMDRLVQKGEDWRNS
jgi:lysophospholipid acyltransferase (LPLAT)-like uncharacterized protein